MDPSCFSDLFDSGPTLPHPDAGDLGSYLPPPAYEMGIQVEQLLYPDHFSPLPAASSGLQPPVHEEDRFPPPVSAESYAFLDPCMSGFFPGSQPMPLQEIEYQNRAMALLGLNDSIKQLHGYGPADFPMITEHGEQRKQRQSNSHGAVGECSSPLISSDISTLDESSFKVGRLSAEERKEKIHRYMKKRSERNFSKKIKYACRKTLADSRPRVRGRFAKNEEFGEVARGSGRGQEHEEDDEEVIGGEEQLLDSDILAHISGMNSFKYNCTLESWI
ncbi:hypothetical protein HPP92_002268 [Vanilla planifolia]|uniref:CCT domain-containing protein n=1 Tax=Vanilla planifolia TaxID=51239 RepID=A0A835RW57_VANPL|nr:hypothetical protein HPP92_002584 [Vanilla planifolia]KAG0502196.1 hypothetical protein HPP92_002268 [Vanilla planifolia]